MLVIFTPALGFGPVRSSSHFGFSLLPCLSSGPYSLPLSHAFVAIEVLRSWEMASFSDLAYVQRQLTIKTGVVKRLAKEESSYLAEARDQQIRIQKFIDQGKDEYDVKQQVSFVFPLLAVPHIHYLV